MSATTTEERKKDIDSVSKNGLLGAARKFNYDSRKKRNAIRESEELKDMIDTVGLFSAYFGKTPYVILKPNVLAIGEDYALRRIKTQHHFLLHKQIAWKELEEIIREELNCPGLHLNPEFFSRDFYDKNAKVYYKGISICSLVEVDDLQSFACALREMKLLECGIIAKITELCSQHIKNEKTESNPSAPPEPPIPHTSSKKVENAIESIELPSFE